MPKTSFTLSSAIITFLLSAVNAQAQIKPEAMRSAVMEARVAGSCASLIAAMSHHEKEGREDVVEALMDYVRLKASEINASPVKYLEFCQEANDRTDTVLDLLGDLLDS
jgi:Na+/phosphate symporter